MRRRRAWTAWAVVVGLLAPGDAMAAGVLDGAYKSSGKTPEGKRYSGKVTIAKKGNAYEIAWASSGEKGVGVLQDDQLVVAYQGKNWFGVMIYTIQKDRKLAGRWIAYGSKGAFGNEILEPDDD